jgi:hypothetical protein
LGDKELKNTFKVNDNRIVSTYYSKLIKMQSLAYIEDYAYDVMQKALRQFPSV